MMRIKLFSTLLILATLFVVSCKKPLKVDCSTPSLAVSTSGFASDETDTIITKVYRENYTPAVVVDTYVNLATTYIFPDPERSIKIEYIFPSINRTYTFENFGERKTIKEVNKGETAECYNTLLFTLDGQEYEIVNTKTSQIVLEK